MYLYAIALGSNRCHGRHGRPTAILRAAAHALGPDIVLRSISRTFLTPAMGVGGRTYANAAGVIETTLPPASLLARLKQIERDFGRRRGRRWGSRVLDLDILLWSGGRWRSRRPALTIPHAGLAQRAFVLDPLVRIARGWKLPGSGRTVAHAHARLTAASRLRRERR